MAISADGEVEWAHRVETCGIASSVAVRGGTAVEVWGSTWDPREPRWLGAWTRTFEL
jgi:hypothetical protein